MLRIFAVKFSRRDSRFGRWRGGVPWLGLPLYFLRLLLSVAENAKRDAATRITRIAKISPMVMPEALTAATTESGFVFTAVSVIVDLSTKDVEAEP